jgi:hypothetical protein
VTTSGAASNTSMARTLSHRDAASDLRPWKNVASSTHPRNGAAVRGRGPVYEGEFIAQGD